MGQLLGVVGRGWIREACGFAGSVTEAEWTLPGTSPRRWEAPGPATCFTLKPKETDSGDHVAYVEDITFNEHVIVDATPAHEGQGACLSW